MAQQHLLLCFEMLRQFFHQIYRAMLAAGTAERNGEITAIIDNKVGQPAFYEETDVIAHFFHTGDVFEKFDHCRIASGKGAQDRIVVWVGQAAHVEYKIGVERDAILVSE